jgi:hypothetical protein
LLSLTVSPFVSYATLAQLTKLHSLTLHTPVLHSWLLTDDTIRQLQDPSVLSQLTGLTSLRINHLRGNIPSQLWESQLASALPALTRLQRLELPCARCEPLANALAQLVTVTQLGINSDYFQTGNALHLPGVQLLRLHHVDWGFLDSGLHAPQLRALMGTATKAGDSNGLVIPMDEPDEVLEHMDLVERCAKGVLRHCNRLHLTSDLLNPEAETVNVTLQVLGSWWLPDPSLVDGSSPLIQASAGDGDAGVEDPVTAAGGWHLRLSDVYLTRVALAALPQGLTHLELW